MKLKTLAITLIAVPVVGYLLAWGYVWLQTGWDMDRLVKAVAPVAGLRYGGVRVSPLGTVSVIDLTVSPHMLDGSLRIDRVSVRTSGLDFLLHGSSALRQGRLPQRLGLELEGIGIDTTGPLWEQISKQSRNDRGRPANGLACDIGSLAAMAGELDALLPAQVVIDLVLLMETGADPGTASFEMQLRQRGFASLGLRAQLAQVPTDLASASTAPVLSALALSTALDPAYANAALALCAEKSGLPLEQLLPALLAQSDAAYVADIGMVPGPGIRELLRGYLSGEPIMAQLAVPPGLDLANLRHYKPEDVPRLLNLQVTLRGAPVDDLTFQAPSAPIAAAPSQSAVRSPGGSATRGAAPTTPARPAALAFADLARCLGCRVQITLRDGRERQGIVDEATGDLVHIKSQHSGGSLTVEVRESETAAIRLLGAQWAH